MMDQIPIERTRALRLLDDRCFELRLFIHEQLTDVWKSLVSWNQGDKKSLTITAAVEGEHTTLDEAITSWKSFRELDTIAQQLWQNLDDFILKPRTDRTDIQNLSFSSVFILKVGLIDSHRNPN